MEQIKREARDYRARLDRRERLRDTWCLIIMSLLVIGLHIWHIL